MQQFLKFRLERTLERLGLHYQLTIVPVTSLFDPPSNSSGEKDAIEKFWKDPSALCSVTAS